MEHQAVDHYSRHVQHDDAHQSVDEHLEHLAPICGARRLPVVVTYHREGLVQGADEHEDYAEVVPRKAQPQRGVVLARHLLVDAIPRYQVLDDLRDEQNGQADDNVDQPFREKLQRVHQGIQKTFHWDLLPATVDYCRYTAMLSGETDSLRYASKGVPSHLTMDANRIWS